MKKIFLLVACCVIHLVASDSLKIVMVGDALLHKSVYDDAFKQGRYDFAPMLESIAPLVESYDVRFYNQETILGGTQLGLSTYPNFNSPQEFGDAMLALGFNLVSLANNHTLDRGEKGVRAMLEYWRTKEHSISDLLTAGSYESKQSRTTPRIMHKNGITYTMLAYTYGTNGIPLPEGKEYLVNVYTKQMLLEDIKAVRDKVDVLIVSMHWGIEYETTPSKEQREFARLLANNGVDIIIGNHPHVIQPIEIIDNTFVAYSLGNFISGQKGLAKNIGALIGLSLHKTKEGKIIFDNIESELIYTHSTQGKNIRLYPFSKLNETLLPNYKAIQKEYNAILFSEFKPKSKSHK
ncbi:CapA family protein [Helicobacter equorum]|uniref:Capsule biosynthesis protein capA n=1 Tax=Helicobacter equorum TaxID=361872 RepID=A0A3D8IRT0_9HELI|nr:CapA family protein [Helicobacter equorum]MDD7346816.1 CapA family protein [Helicobacter sp.]MDY2822814.1 CapA family protein [Helicobacter sp.]RDU67291.1 capsule biosynthesis protein capA [Helicobacter equorum]